MLRLIGYWIESVWDSRYVPPQELVCEYEPAVRDTLADYLDAGLIYAAYRGYSSCRFCCGIPWEQMGSRELSDGEWVWPEGLSHYIRVHHVRLPNEFIDHALGGKQPDNPTLGLLRRIQEIEVAEDSEYSEEAYSLRRELPPASDDFWVAWCSTERSGALKQRLHLAREIARERAEERLAEEVQRLVEKDGLSNQACCWRGCQEMALREKAMCARHLIDSSGFSAPGGDLDWALNRSSDVSQARY